MKAKLVKYPYSEKKYRWDTWYQGKEFQYFWDESLPNNFETIEPYIKKERITAPLVLNESEYGVVSLSHNIDTNIANAFKREIPTTTDAVSSFTNGEPIAGNNAFAIKYQNNDIVDHCECEVYYTLPTGDFVTEAGTYDGIQFRTGINKIYVTTYRLHELDWVDWDINQDRTTSMPTVVSINNIGDTGRMWRA